MKKRNIIILIVVLLFILLGIIGYSLLSYNEEAIPSSKKYEVFDISPYLKKDGEHTIKGKKLSFDISLKEQLISIYINDVLVYQNGDIALSLDKKVYLYDDYMVLSKSGEGNTVIMIYNPVDNSTNPYSYIDQYGLTINGFKATDDGLVVTGTKVFDDFIYYDNQMISIDSCENYKKVAEEVASGTFLKKYTSGEGFSGYEEQSVQKVKDISKYKELCK